MANHHQFQSSSSCSSTGWWSTARTTTSAGSGGFNDPTMSLSVSPSTTELGGSFNWPSAAGDMFEAKSRSSDESPVSISNSSITFQDIQNSHVTTPQALDFGLSWTQPFFGRADNSFHSLLQEDVISRPYVDQPGSAEIEPNQIHLGIDQASSLRSSFLQDHNHVLSSNISSIPFLSPSSSALLQGLLEPDSRLQRSFYDAQQQPIKNKSSINYQEELDESLVKTLPQFIKALPSKQQVAETVHSNFHHGRPSQVQVQSDNNSSYCSSNLIAKANSGVGGSLSSLEKKIGSAPVVKKPRLGTPSSLPTFKVRKEKLGDRITALQQLVSPFGKTDTASVLHEAIEYIKFLHDQVRVSSAPYLKNGQQMQQVKSMEKPKDCEGQDQDLRSRGLCLVPISSTFAVANEIPTDFWTPTFVGSFR
ncbi:transcription factor bHLH112-like [Canna indica]|uniref:Transcription factor bHLH112-like n=1 Tax=Canna indica TaxID=4628 RepID=A0AAQ3JU04_9LILI|nr:transcription factor bHLH112-like [Canna indica]